MKYNLNLKKFMEDGRIVNSGILIVRFDKEDISILLLKRKDHKHWEIPGGKVELFDRINNFKYTILKNTAIREIKEEIGIDFTNKLENIKPFFIDFTSPDNKKRRSYNFISFYDSLPKQIENNFSEG
jgi:8-oxo-dGTP pyrophosphatase MutT (NUDIX family)